MREKRLVLGARHKRIVADVNGEDQTAAPWKTYPREPRRVISFEIPQKEADAHKPDEGGLISAPVWYRGERRTGGYEKPDRIYEEATEYRISEALVAGMSSGARNAYIRGLGALCAVWHFARHDPVGNCGKTGAGWGNLGSHHVLACRMRLEAVGYYW